MTSSGRRRGRRDDLIDPLGLDACGCPVPSQRDMRLRAQSSVERLTPERANQITMNRNTMSNAQYFGASAAFGFGGALWRIAAIPSGGASLTAGALGVPSNPRHYAHAGEIHATSFFDHGDHVQMVTRIYNPGGELIRVDVVEGCGGGN